MSKRAFKHHKGGSIPKCSIVTLFMILWLFVMTGGMIFMFQDDIMKSLQQFEEGGGIVGAVRKSTDAVAVNRAFGQELLDGGSNSYTTVRSVAAKPPPVENQPEDSSSTYTVEKVVPKQKPALRKDGPLITVKDEPIELYRSPTMHNTNLSLSESSALPGFKRKKITEVVKFDTCIAPPPLLKGKDMWKMSVQAQRQYLQDIHCNESEPSPAAADKFIAEARASLLDTSAMSAPSVWDVPLDIQRQIRQSKPGDVVRYRIAGKEVSLPYGYPDESIFVLTASYRDPEVAYTIARAYARAAHPERIFFGIHAQNAAGSDEEERDPIGGLPFTGVKCPSHPVCSRLHQIHVSRAHWSRSEGPTVARAIAEQFYNNETYTMGIDSHCHFLRGWDNVGIDMFRRIGNDHAIISTYPPGYTSRAPKGDGSEDYDVDSKPHTQTAFFAAGFSFSRGHRILRVPYDMHTPYIFDGEEISMGVRAWTWGYDLYQPDRDIITHLYIAAHSSVRPVFWDSAFWGIQWPTQFGALLRIQKQLRIFDKLQKTEGIYKGKLDLDEFEIYDAGPRRSAVQFWKWAKVDLQNNWGEHCSKPGHPEITGRPYCYSDSLCDLYNREGGMEYVPWKAGTEDLFPPMIRTDKYPPKI